MTVLSRPWARTRSSAELCGLYPMLGNASPSTSLAARYRVRTDSCRCLRFTFFCPTVRTNALASFGPALQEDARRTAGAANVGERIIVWHRVEKLVSAGRSGWGAGGSPLGSLGWSFFVFFLAACQPAVARPHAFRRRHIIIASRL